MSEEAQPAADHIPPGSPPAVAAGVEERQPRRRTWGLLDALPVILFLLFLAALSLTSISEQPPRTPQVNVRALLVVQSIFYLLIVLYVYSVVCLKCRLRFWEGLRWPMSAAASRPPGFYLVAGAGLAVFVQILSLPVTNKLPIERLFENREAAFLLAAFGILVAPLVEEIIFRGFIFGAVETAWGVSAAIWSTALLFATIHIPQLRGGTSQILTILIVGLVLSWVRWRTGSMAPPYFVHLAYNAALFTMLYFATQGFRRFGEG